MTYLRSILIVIVVMLNTFVVSSQQVKPLIRFGLIADIQYCDCETAGKRFYRNSLLKLEECVNDLNKEQVQFTINLGDLVDRNPESFLPVLSRLNKLKAEVYNTTGNHDYDGITNNKSLYKKLGMPGEYYSFTKHNWRFIVLNTNEVASYSNVKGTKKEKELEDMLKISKESGRRNAAGYNGGISQKQMQWLKKELDKSQKKNEQVIVLSHHPLYPENGLTALNNREILTLIETYPNVKLLLAGHHHPGAFAMYKDIPVVTVEGMIETENNNAYGLVEIYADKIILQGKGRVSSREFLLR